MGKPLFVIILVLCVIGSVGVVHSEEWNAQELQELTQKADLVLTGKVQSIRSEWNESETMIYTYIDIEPEAFFKNTTEEKITLKLLGGRVGETATVALGFPEFRKNDEVLLFLKQGRDNPYHWIIGPSKGKFDINTDSNTGNKIVTNKDVPQKSMQLNEFISMIQSQMNR